LGAINVGIDAVGIRFGYAKEGELEMYKNAGVFDTAKELEEFLMKG
jgi:phosphoglycolate phosphatase-like HAD superfamily hydrolase